MTHLDPVINTNLHKDFFSELPDDIIFSSLALNISKKITFPELLIPRQVSKKWKAKIENPRFLTFFSAVNTCTYNMTIKKLLDDYIPKVNIKKGHYVHTTIVKNKNRKPVGFNGVIFQNELIFSGTDGCQLGLYRLTQLDKNSSESIEQNNEIFNSSKILKKTKNFPFKSFQIKSLNWSKSRVTALFSTIDFLYIGNNVGEVYKMNPSYDLELVVNVKNSVCKISIDKDLMFISDRTLKQAVFDQSSNTLKDLGILYNRSISDYKTVEQFGDSHITKTPNNLQLWTTDQSHFNLFRCKADKGSLTTIIGQNMIYMFDYDDEIHIFDFSYRI